jgi:hypothetical protein
MGEKHKEEIMSDNRVDSISEVIQIIRNYEKKYKIKFSLYDSKLQKIFLLISIGTYIAAWIIAFARPTGIYDFVGAVSLWAVSFIFYILYLLLNFYIPTSKRLLKPMDTHLEKIQKATEREDELIKNLADIHISTLDQTIKRLGYEVDFLERRNTEITGLFQKLAIIPAVVVIYIAYSKKEIADAQFLFEYAPYIFAFFLGLFIGAFIAHGLIDRIKLFNLIIESAKVKAEIKNTLQIQR